MCKLPFRDGEFDYVLALNVIYHGNECEVRRAIGEVRRVLRPGGVFQGTLLSKRHREYGLGREISRNTFIQEHAPNSDRDRTAQTPPPGRQHQLGISAVSAQDPARRRCGCILTGCLTPTWLSLRRRRQWRPAWPMICFWSNWTCSDSEATPSSAGCRSIGASLPMCFAAEECIVFEWPILNLIKPTTLPKC